MPAFPESQLVQLSTNKPAPRAKQKSGLIRSRFYLADQKRERRCWTRFHPLGDVIHRQSNRGSAI
jgi:hypothetical protein